MQDTIFAEATAPGRAGVSIIRVSGSRAPAVLSVFGIDNLKPRLATLRKLREPEGILDEALVLFFEENQSFTGETVVEFHLHGSRAIVRRMLTLLAEQPGLRMAEAGEFTRRALENGRMDLTQVEGLGDLINAETEAQRRQAYVGFSGGLSAKAADWRTDLVHAAALLEATLDFAEEDVPDNVVEEVQALIARTRDSLRSEIAGAEAAERVRDGFEVAIVGRPNVGKSTLLNALARRDVALISDLPGTTRDVLEVSFDLGGLAVTLIDTAGVRETEDTVEAMGVARARDRAFGADIRVFLVEPGDNPEELGVDIQAGDIIARAKADLHGADLDFAISGQSGAGLDELLQELRIRLEDLSARAGLATNLRQRLAIEGADQALLDATTRLTETPDATDLISEDLRRALGSLDVLIGRVDVENILDVVFSSFCIGK